MLDFGGGGASATLLEAASDFEPISATMRCTDFSGDEIDQALLLRVFEELGHGSGIDPDSTAGVGQLGELRDQCRAAKERLSTETTTELAGVLGRRRCSMTVTRDELEDLIQDRLNSFIYAFDDMLRRNKKTWADLAAVVTVGGGASIPLVTATPFKTRPDAGPDRVAASARGGGRRVGAGLAWRKAGYADAVIHRPVQGRRR